MRSPFDLDQYVHAALAAAPAAFLLNEVAAERLFHAVLVVAVGQALLAPSVAGRLIA